jgi:putative phage-type endonuclease
MITAKQKEQRKQYIGSSDASAIMNLDPWRSPADVWLEKTGQLAERGDSDAMEAGRFLERAVLDWAEQQLGTTLLRDQFLTSPTGHRCANLDGITPKSEIVEAKTTGILGRADDEYGEADTDELPDRVLIQVHHQFGVCGPDARVAWVPVLIGGTGFRMYRVERNQQVVDAVIGAADGFWENYVETNKRPDDYKPSLEVLKRIRRVPQSVVRVEHVIAETLINAREVRLQAEKVEKAALDALLTAMDTAEAAQFGGGVITYFEYQRKGYTVEPGSYRRLGFPKAGKILINHTPISAA